MQSMNGWKFSDKSFLREAEWRSTASFCQTSVGYALAIAPRNPRSDPADEVPHITLRGMNVSRLTWVISHLFEDRKQPRRFAIACAKFRKPGLQLAAIYDKHSVFG